MKTEYIFNAKERAELDSIEQQILALQMRKAKIYACAPVRYITETKEEIEAALEMKRIIDGGIPLNEIAKIVTKERLQAEEEKVFYQKVADGTLKEFKGLETILDVKKEVLFCNKKIRHNLLKTNALYSDTHFIVSECIPDGEIYLLTDKKLKKQIIKGREGQAWLDQLQKQQKTTSEQ